MVVFLRAFRTFLFFSNTIIKTLREPFLFGQHLVRAHDSRNQAVESTARSMRCLFCLVINVIGQIGYSQGKLVFREIPTNELYFHTVLDTYIRKALAVVYIVVKNPKVHRIASNTKVCRTIHP